MLARLVAAAAMAAVALQGSGHRASAGQPQACDAALVLALDFSSSMDRSELAMQSDGTAAAFESAALKGTIVSGRHGRIAVAVVGFGAEATTAVPWTIVSSPPEADAMARGIRRIFPDFLDRDETSISSAMREAASLFRDIPCLPARKVLDISGDGIDKDQAALEEARGAVLSAGATINGLTVGYGGISEYKVRDGSRRTGGIESFYRDVVIGGEGAFSFHAVDFEGFAEAILMKIMREIS
jgi:hypothetical protein